MPALSASPSLGTVFSMQVQPELVQKFHGCLTHALKDTAFDAYGELALTLRDPLELEETYNGGVWLEGFQRQQVAHTHLDDNKGAKERYLLVVPYGADGHVDILQSDDAGSIVTAERYIFPENCLSLLHFDGTRPHRFATAGNGADDMLHAIAFHVRDIDTSLDALTAQTRPLSYPMPVPVPARTFAPSCLPAAVDTGTLAAHFSEACARLNAEETQVRMTAPFAFHDVIRVLEKDGCRFGSNAPDLVDLEPLGAWRAYMEGRDQRLQIPRP